MVIETEGIVLKQVKTANGKKILTIFTPKYGKISIACNIAPQGKNKSSLFSRPFSYAKYNISKGREIYSLNSADVIDSYYSIGEDFDKYIVASYALELVEKLVFEDQPEPRLFNLLNLFLSQLVKREKKHTTLLICFMVKILSILGVMPNISNCSCCGSENVKEYFSISSGGMICKSCAKALFECDNNQLIYDTKFDIIETLKYLEKEPFETFNKVALNDKVEKELKKILLEYIKYHLEIGELKTADLDLC